MTEQRRNLVAVILVNWKGADDTLSCLASLSALEGEKPFVIVVENGSGDESAATLRAAAGIDALIESKVNLGFGGGCNLAITQARAAGFGYVWLLNNDANPAPDALGALLAVAAADAGLGAVGSVIYRDAAFQDVDCWGGGRVSFWTGQPRQLRAPGVPNFLTGASLLLRLDALAAVGGFDERFFLYWEDTDLSFRLRQAGWRLAVAPGSRIRHAVSASAAKSGRNLTRYYNNGAVLFFSRHAPVPFVPILANLIYRFVGQMRAGEFANALIVLKVSLRIDRVSEVSRRG
jgi:GT2 family glycosyltransferase